jgi:hypothetical protein
MLRSVACSVNASSTLARLRRLQEKRLKSRDIGFFVHDAKTFRVRAGVRVKRLEELTGLSRSTITRIEGDSGTSEVSAYAYLRALKQLSPDYPFLSPFTRPKNAKVKVVNIDSATLESK